MAGGSAGGAARGTALVQRVSSDTVEKVCTYPSCVPWCVLLLLRRSALDAHAQTAREHVAATRCCTAPSTGDVAPKRWRPGRRSRGWLRLYASSRRKGLLGVWCSHADTDGNGLLTHICWCTSARASSGWRSGRKSRKPRSTLHRALSSGKRLPDCGCWRGLNRQQAPPLAKVARLRLLVHTEPGSSLLNTMDKHELFSFHICCRAGG